MHIEPGEGCLHKKNVCRLLRPRANCTEYLLKLAQIAKLGVTQGMAPSSEWPNQYIKQLNYICIKVLLLYRTFVAYVSLIHIILNIHGLFPTGKTKECGDCGNFGDCSESCGAEGIKEGTKECWLVDGKTGLEVPSSRETLQCNDTCYDKCPPIPRCGLCGNYGSCSESCGAEGTKEGTKDCWFEDADTGEEIDNSRHGVNCSETCFKECLCKVYNSYRCLVVEMSYFIN